MVYFTETAISDLDKHIPRPEDQEALVLDINARLSTFPTKYRACPSFGPEARSYSDGRYTIIHDVHGPNTWVRHVFPSRGRQAAALMKDR